MTADKQETAGSSRTALMLPGGGARGAYQVGVLKAIAEFIEDAGKLQQNSAGKAALANPFPIISGTSAGAINAGMLASHGQSLATGVQELEQVWGQMRSEHIFRTDLSTVIRYSLRWFASIYMGFFGFTPPHSLLDSSPLAELLTRHLNPEGIREAIKSGALYALAVNASGYSRSSAISYFQGHPEITPWKRGRREGVRTAIEVRHLMASSALPVIFPATRIGNEYFGDGGMRQTAPLSAAIHLGAQKILIISTRDIQQDEEPPAERLQYPSLGEIGGAMMDIIFLDNLAADLDRLERVNRTVSKLDSQERKALGLRPIEVIAMSPSQDVRCIAQRHSHEVPRTMRFLMRRFGASGDGNRIRLPSYLLFEPGFCQALIDLGYQDACQRRAELETFLGIAHPDSKETSQTKETSR